MTSGDDRVLQIILRARDEASKQIASATSSITRSFEKAEGASQAAAAGIFGVGAALAGAGLAGIKAASDLESMQVALTTAFQGNRAAADAAAATITTFAAKTPYQLDEVMRSFVKLKNMGLDPSQEALTAYGDTASAMGKGLNDMVEAVADAATGEFERLKEFGIRASSEGDKVSFTFQGVTTTVGKNSKEIEQYLIKLGKTKFAGGMEAQSQTLGGMFSTLKDNINLSMAQIVRDIGLFDVAKRAISSVSSLIERYGDDLAAGIVKGLDWIKANGPIIAGVLAGVLTPAVVGLVASLVTGATALAPFIAAGALIGAVWQLNLGGIQEKVKGLFDLLVKGDFTKTFREAFGVEEDAPLVGFLLQVRESVMNIGTAAQGIYDLFVNGDFTSAFRTAFHLEEDNPLVGQLFEIREGALQLWDAVQNQLAPSLAHLWEVVGPILIPVLQVLAGVLLLSVIGAIKGVITVVTWLVQSIALAADGIANAITWIVEKATWLKDNWVEAIGYMIGFIATLPFKLPFFLGEAIGKMIVLIKNVDWGGLWNGLTDAAGRALDWIKNLDWGGILKGISKGVANGIMALVEGAINGALSGLPGIPKLKLPRYEQGGWVPETGLAILHKGEYVASKPELGGRPRSDSPFAGGMNGPQIIINATLNGNADIDLLGQRLAHSLATSGRF